MSKRTFRITMCIMALVLSALIGMNTALDNEKNWDISYEMTNTHVSWQQTFYQGGMEQ